MIDINQMGKIVLFLYPTPNSRKLPSDLYINAGFDVWIIPNNIINNIIAAVVTFSAINNLNIFVSNISIF